MRLYVNTMDLVVVDFSVDGLVLFDNGEWAKPTVQERRAIIHAAQSELDSLKELLELLDAQQQGTSR